MMIVVLIQNPKGGGLGAGFGGGSSSVMGGVKQTTDFLEKATWTLVVALFVLSIISTAFVPSNQNAGGEEQKSRTENVLDGLE